MSHIEVKVLPFRQTPQFVYFTSEQLQIFKNASYKADQDRYAAALVVAKKVLSHAYYGTSGLVTDFRVPASYFGEFYLKNLVDNIQDTDMIYYNYFSNDFNNMDYDYHVSD